MVQGVSMSGMASGIDTDQVINQLMELEQESVQRLEEEKGEIESEQSAWQGINQLLSGFDNSISELNETETFENRIVHSGDESSMTATAEPGANEGNYEISVNQLASGQRVAGDSLEEIVAGDPEEIDRSTELDVGEGSFEIGTGEEDELITIDVDPETGIEGIVDGINESSAESGVEATIWDERLILSTVETGTDNEINFSDEEEILQDLGVLEVEDNGNGEAELIFSEPLQEAQDAEFEVDGLNITRSSNTGLDDVIDDVTIDLHSVSSDRFNLEIRNDEEGTREAIDNFVDEYNKIQNHLSEATDEEEILQGDVTARRLQNNLRNMVMESIPGDGKFDSLAELGIEIDPDGQELGFDGTMEITDEQTLNNAIQHNPEELQELFTGEDGIANRVSDTVENYIETSGAGRHGSVIDQRIDSLDNEMNRVDDRIMREEDQMERREQRLRQQFTQMELALNDMHAQSSWLSGQIQNLEA